MRTSSHTSPAGRPERAGQATPVWFGPPERPLLGWMHRPADGRARGAVVLCPPVGAELNSSQYVLRVLARELAAAGLLTLRFDYDGTGQSAGDFNDPGRLRAWTAGIGHAVDLVRGEGVSWVAGVGLRLGATLLANAAAGGCRLDSLVLWDPHSSGKAFLREEMAMALSLPGARVQDGAEIPGHILAQNTVAELTTLELPPDPAPAGTRVLALVDPARPQTQRLRRLLQGAGVEWQEHCEQTPLFDKGATEFHLPGGIIAQLTSWLAGACEGAEVALPGGRAVAAAAAVGHTADGRPIVEELMWVAPTGLFGIACRAEEPAGGAEGPAAKSTAPVLMFLTTGAESSIGPGRLWVELAREWAHAGLRTVRFDLSGIGESRTRPGGREREIYSPFAVADIVEMAHAASPEDPANIVLIGVSSGAYFGLEAGALLRCRGVVSVNAVLEVRPSTQRGSEGADGAPARPARRRPSMRPLAERLGGLLARLLAPLAARVPRGHHVRRRMINRIPPPAWRIVFKVRRGQSPARLIVPLLDAGVPALMLSGEWEAELPLLRTPRAVQRLRDADHSGFVVVPQLDHSLMNAASREVARDAVARFVGEIAAAGSRDAPQAVAGTRAPSPRAVA